MFGLSAFAETPFAATPDSIVSNAITGTSSLTFTPTASIAGQGAITASTTLVFSPTATITDAANNNITGASSLTFTPSASVTGTRQITGSSSLTFTPAATIADAAGNNITGATTLTFSPTATLTNAGPAIFYEQGGGGQSPLKRKKRAAVPDWLDKLTPLVVVVEETPQVSPTPVRVDIAALKARADAAEAIVARLEAQKFATAKRERTVARLKTDHAAALVALGEARQAEWQAILRDEDELFLLAA